MAYAYDKSGNGVIPDIGRIYPGGSALGTTVKGITFPLDIVGATDRSINDRFADFPSIRELGAVGDNTTLNTSILQKAADLQRPFRVPEGTFLSDEIQMRPNSQLVGTGPKCIVKKRAAGRDIFGLDASIFKLAGADNCKLRNFAIDGSADLGASIGSYAVMADGSTALQNVDIEDMTIYNVGGAGIALLGSTSQVTNKVGIRRNNLKNLGAHAIVCQSNINTIDIDGNIIEDWGIGPSPYNDVPAITASRAGYMVIIRGNNMKHNGGASTGSNRHGISVEGSDPTGDGGIVVCNANNVWGAPGFGFELSSSILALNNCNAYSCGAGGYPAFAVTTLGGLSDARSDVSLSDCNAFDSVCSFAILGAPGLVHSRVSLNNCNFRGRANATGTAYHGMHITYATEVRLNNVYTSNHKYSGVWLYKVSKVYLNQFICRGNNQSSTAGSGGLVWLDEASLGGLYLGVGNIIEGNNISDQVLYTDFSTWAGSDTRMYGLPSTTSTPGRIIRDASGFLKIPVAAS